MQLLASAVLWEKMLLDGMSQHELVAIAAGCGCAGVEFRPYWHDTDHELPLIQKALQKQALLSAYACNEGLFSSALEPALLSLAAMKQSLSLARRLNAAVLRINVAPGPFDPALLENNNWRQSVCELINLAAAANITLALENPPLAAGGHPAFIHKIITSFSSPWLKATFDTGNWLPAGQQPLRALDILGDGIGYVHLKDMAGQPGNYNGCYLGAGALDLRGLIQRLALGGYRGLYVLEFPGGPDPVSLIQASKKYLRAGKNTGS